MMYSGDTQNTLERDPLPLAGRDREGGRTGEQPRPTPEDTRPGRILIAGTRRANLEALRHRLKPFPFEVETALGLTVAIKKAVENMPDVVVLDVRPHEVGGYYFCLAMRRDPVYRKVPVIALRSPSDRRDAGYARQMGAVACLEKPVKLDQLIGRLRTCIFQRRRQQQVDLVTQPVLYVTSSRERAGMMKRAVNAKNFLKKTHYRLVPVTSLMDLRSRLRETSPSAIVLDEKVACIDTSLMCYSLKTQSKFRDVPLVVLLSRPEDARRFGTADVRLPVKAHRDAMDAINHREEHPSEKSPAA
jgi:DNA-binding response OmpR family regulator